MTRCAFNIMADQPSGHLHACTAESGHDGPHVCDCGARLTKGGGSVTETSHGPLDLDSPELRAELVHTLTGTGRDPGYMADKVLETLREHTS